MYERFSRAYLLQISHYWIIGGIHGLSLILLLLPLFGARARTLSTLQCTLGPLLFLVLGHQWATEVRVKRELAV